jgi:oligogalacturonide lyase
MGLDADDDFVYFCVGGPETADLSPGQKLLPGFGPRFRQTTSGLRAMNLKTGEIKSIVNVGFGIGHVQTNPWMPGEIVFCWETGGKAPQRTWIIKFRWDRPAPPLSRGPVRMDHPRGRHRQG